MKRTNDRLEQEETTHEEPHTLARTSQREDAFLISAVIFDFGHTIMNELHERDGALESRSVRFMPGIPDILPCISLPMGIWANTRVAREQDVRYWLDKAGINRYFKWVITSVEAGARKPDSEFFSYALANCGLRKEQVLFVGNQLNTDIEGAISYGIKSVWLSGEDYRSPDDKGDRGQKLLYARPTYQISSLVQLPNLLREISADPSVLAYQVAAHPSKP
jgi:phosphoglycolate phosphatase-like HAD superfamily hydrolase